MTPGDEAGCPRCGAKRGSLRDHASHAARQAFDKRGNPSARSRRDPELLRHAERLEWSISNGGTMRSAPTAPAKRGR